MVSCALTLHLSNYCTCVHVGQARLTKYQVMLMQRETENQNNFEHVYTLLDLDEPSARSIRDLDNIMGVPCLPVTWAAKSPFPMLLPH